MSTPINVKVAQDNLRTSLLEHTEDISAYNNEQRTHEARTDNPHDATGTVLELDQLQNYPIVQSSELQTPEPTDRYMAPSVLSEGWDAYIGTLEALTSLRRPVALSPVASIGGQSMTPTLHASPIAVDEQNPATFIQREYEVDVSTGDFSSPVWAGASDDDAAIVLDSALQSKTWYQWRCRDVSVEGEASHWSTPALFETRLGIVLPPTVSVPTAPNGAFDVQIGWVGTQPSEMDTHGATSLQIATDPEFTQVVFSVEDQTDPLNTVSVTTLEDTTAYYVRAKVKGSVLGDSVWSEADTLTTGISEAQLQTYEIDGDTTILSTDGDFLGGGTTQSPMVPFVGYRDSEGQMVESFLLTDITTHGRVVSVTQHTAGTSALIMDELTDQSVLVRFDENRAVLWSKQLTDTVGHCVVSYGELAIVVGYRPVGGVNEAVMLCLNSDGSEKWANKAAGAGNYEALSALIDNNRLFVCGRQDAQSGTVTVTESGFVAQCNPISGAIIADMSFGSGANTHFNDITVVGTSLIAVGSVDGVAAAVRFNTSQNLEVIGHYQWTSLLTELTSASTDGTYVYVGGITSTGTVVASLNASMTTRWLRTVNQSHARPQVTLGSAGLEFVSSYLETGKTKAAIVRMPINGSVGTVPDAVDFTWASPSIVQSVTAGVAATTVGAWSSWYSEKLVTSTRNTTTTSPPSASLVPLPSNTDTERYQNPQWVDRYFLGNNTSVGLWEQYSLDFLDIAGSLNGSYNYQPYLPSLPSQSGYEFEANSSVTNRGAWSGNFVVQGSSYSDYKAAELAYILGSVSSTPSSSSVVHLVSTRAPLESDGPPTWRVVRTYRFRIITVRHNVRRRTVTTYSTYRWTAKYDKSTRTIDAVRLNVSALSDLVLNAVTNPAKVPVVFDRRISNF